MALSSLVHPEYSACCAEWLKWRAVYEGGECFLRAYLEKFSDRENDIDFCRRLKLSPIPEFAKSSIIDIRNGLAARLGKVTREGGPASYEEAVKGRRGGVDLNGATMDFFLGEKVLNELLPMGKIGVWVDRAPLPQPASRLDSSLNHPYLYCYRREEILNWRCRPRGDYIDFDMVLLRECHYLTDPVYGLYCGEIELYRLAELIDTLEGPKVRVRFYKEEVVKGDKGNELRDVQVDQNGIPTDEDTIIDISTIPFHVFEIDSLLKGVANHQIALLNTESSDIQYIIDANFPFYTEMKPLYGEGAHLKDEGTGEDGGERVVDVGIKRGRTYAHGLDRPGFIHPSSEPIRASMEKQKNLKDDIRTLVNLALSNVRPKFASAESKEMDEHGLEGGLASVGRTLAHGEKRIGYLWALYENGTPPTIAYPERYSLKSGEERRKDAEQIKTLKKEVPSPTFRRELDKQIARTILEDKVSDEVLAKVISEIEVTKYPTADPDELRSDVEAGLVTAETASLARGWAPGEAEKAAKEKAEKLAQSQALNQGSNADGAMARKEEKAASQSPDSNVNGEKLVRGEADNA